MPRPTDLSVDANVDIPILPIALHLLAGILSINDSSPRNVFGYSGTWFL